EATIEEPPVSANTTVSSSDDEARPGSGQTAGVPPVIGHAWASMATDPTETEPCPGSSSQQPYLDRLTAAVERLTAARSLSRQLHALAEEAPMITNEQLADQLLALANRARALP
ncbi:MAG: hypothetical protein WBF75_01880, partial [Pseudonocardiaceae bacterium]